MPYNMAETENNYLREEEGVMHGVWIALTVKPFYSFIFVLFFRTLLML